MLFKVSVTPGEGEWHNQETSLMLLDSLVSTCCEPSLTHSLRKVTTPVMLLYNFPLLLLPQYSIYLEVSPVIDRGKTLNIDRN